MVLRFRYLEQGFNGVIMGWDEARSVCLRNRAQSIGMFRFRAVIVSGRVCWCRMRRAAKIGQAHC